VNINNVSLIDYSMIRKIIPSKLIAILLLSGCASTNKPSPAEFPQQHQHWLSWHQRWIGTPHYFGGNSQRGIDCSAYVQRGFRELYGIELPRTVKLQSKQGNLVNFADLQTGDLVFFRPDTYPHHVGVYLGDGTFTHVSSKKGVIRSRLDKGYWHKRFLKGRRISQ
jgi:cell wall-associated NlpC family hydrolase